jgi:hypothetical protein
MDITPMDRPSGNHYFRAQERSGNIIVEAVLTNGGYGGVLVAPPGYEFDLGQAAAYMQLAAFEHGVGSCVTVLHDHAAARSILTQRKIRRERGRDGRSRAGAATRQGKGAVPP